MNSKVFKYGIVGGIVLFLVSMFFWGVLPLNKTHMHKFANEKAVVNVLKENAPENGIYVLPHAGNYPAEGEDPAFEAAKNHFFAFSAIKINSESPSLVEILLKSLILKIVVACLVVALMLKAKLDDTQKMKFIAVAGLAISLTAVLPFTIWVGFPMGFSAAYIVENFIGWLIAAIVIARMSRTGKKR